MLFLKIHSVKDEMYHSIWLRRVEWTFHLSPHENICTIALINIHYLYTNVLLELWSAQMVLKGQCNLLEINQDTVQTFSLFFWLFWKVCLCLKLIKSSTAVASLTVPGGWEFHFLIFSSNFNQFFLFFLKLYLFFPSFWPSGWTSSPPGKALAMPLKSS